MNTNKRAVLAAAKAIAKKLDMDAIILIGVGSGQYQAVSYGSTKAICNSLHTVVDGQSITAVVQDIADALGGLGGSFTQESEY